MVEAPSGGELLAACPFANYSGLTVLLDDGSDIPLWLMLDLERATVQTSLAIRGTPATSP